MRLLFLILFIPVLLQARDNPEKEILDALNRQLDCWNKADLQCFMDGYWRSDSLMFISKNGVNYGWEKVYERYRDSYPNQAAMGTLEFKIIDFQLTGESSAFLVGEWKVMREDDILRGHFSLLWRKIDGKWRIVADHTS